jgi:hypothetical protein
MSIFKESFPAEIGTQIGIRQDLLVRRKPEDMSYLTSRKAWVRLTSGVDTLEDKSDAGKDKPTPALARQYVLQGGTLYDSPPNAPYTGSLRSGIGASSDKAYSTTTPSGKTHRLGIRPMPGITSIDIKSKSAYGSLREATVSFVCWDIKQLEDLELLYMRPGFTVLLEWGWSPYINNANKYTTIVKMYEKFISGDVPKGDTSLQEIYKELHQLSVEQSGNYDAMIGYVKNFQWSFRADGGYDCTTSIISFGEVLESLKINYSTPDIALKDKLNGFLGIGENSYKSNFPKVYNKSKLAGLIYEMASYMADNLAKSERDASDGISYLNTAFGGLYYDLFAISLKFINGNNTVAATQDPNKTDTLPAVDTYQYYITLESFCQLLNEYILVTTEKGKLAGVSTLDRKYYSPTQTKSSIPSPPASPSPQSFYEQQAAQNPFIIAPSPVNAPPITFGQFTTAQNLISTTPSTLSVTGSALLCLANPLQISVDPSICLINSPLWSNGFKLPKVNENADTSAASDDVHQSGLGNAEYSAEAKSIVQKIIDYYIDGTGTIDAIKKQNIKPYLENKIDKDKRLEELKIQYEVLRGGKQTVESTTSTGQGPSVGIGGTNISTQTIYSISPIDLKSSNGIFFKEKFSGFPSFNEFCKGDFLPLPYSGERLYWFYDGKQAINTTVIGNVPGKDIGTTITLSTQGEINSLKDIIKNDGDLTSIAQTIDDKQTYNEASKNATESAKANTAFLKNLSPFFKDNDPYKGLGYISNIYVNLNFLYQLALNQNLESQDKKEKNEINLYDYLKRTLEAIQPSIGNTNNLDIHVDPGDSIGRIIDINFATDDPAGTFKNAFEIEVQGTKTTARNVSLQSQIFPEQGSIVAISAQNGGGTLGLDNATLVGFNRGIKDRILPDKYAPKKGISSSDTTENKLVNIKECIGNLAQFFVDLQSIHSYPLEANQRSYNTDNSGEYKNALQEFINVIKALSNDPNQFKAIIPTKLTLTIDGIGGIIIGNLFKIPEDSLPRGYKGEKGIGRKLGYIVTGLSHKIDTGFWETTIDSQTVILETNETTKTKFDYEGIIIVEDPSVTPPVTRALGATKGFNQDNIAKAMSFFISKGFSNAAAAAAVGSFLQESQLNPKIVNYNDKLPVDAETQTYAAGIAQWIGYGGRRSRLLKYAAAKGINIPNFEEAYATYSKWDKAGVSARPKQSDTVTIIRNAFSNMTLEVQLEYVEEEMKTYKGFTEFKNSTDTNVAARWMYEIYEGGDYTPGAALGSRVSYAADLVVRANKGEFTPTPYASNIPKPPNTTARQQVSTNVGGVTLGTFGQVIR